MVGKKQEQTRQKRTRQQNVRRLQALVARHISPERSLVDELIQERKENAVRE
jgi:hypothetical protein